MIIVKIDLRKIDQSKCFNGKNGAKYLDIVLLENRDGEDQYGNHFVAVQGVTKEDRENKIRGAILGNAKTIGAKPSAKPQETRRESYKPEDTEGDDIPF
jgi:hypothetical protein